MSEGGLGANDGFERLVYDARKAAERFNRQYSVSRRLDSFARSAALRVRELDQELGLQQKWRTFTFDFRRNWPRYRKDISGFLESPLGKSSSTIFFLWFALSGWLFRFIILATWVLPFAAPLLIGKVANNFVIEELAQLARGISGATAAKSSLVQTAEALYGSLGTPSQEGRTLVLHLQVQTSLILRLKRNDRLIPTSQHGRTGECNTLYTSHSCQNFQSDHALSSVAPFVDYV